MPRPKNLTKREAEMLDLLIEIVKSYDQTRTISMQQALKARRTVNRIYGRPEDD